MDIDIAVTNQLAGEDVPEVVTIRVGGEEVTYWSGVRIPAYEAAYGVEHAAENDEFPTLRAGMTLGAAVHFDPDWKMWLLMGEPLFTLTVAGLEFQQILYRREELVPEELEGLGLEGAAQVLHACPNSERTVLGRAAGRRRMVVDSGGHRHYAYVAALCYERSCVEPPPAGVIRCRSNEDCPGELSCEDDLCQ